MSDLRKPDWPLLRRERTLAMTQLAVYEAANAVHPEYEPSHLAVSAEAGASISAAIIEAAYQILVNQIPDDYVDLKTEHDKHLVAVPDNPSKVAGVVAGMRAAQAVIHWRENDGADWSTTYQPHSGPGAYQPTSNEPVESPLVARMKPFVIPSTSAFLPGPPPSLDSTEYRRDLEEVKGIGAFQSSVRTSDQTEQGLYYRTAGLWPWNDIARKAIAAHKMDELASARVLALMDIAVMDAHLAAWDTKYKYNGWRPITAIHVGVPGSKGDPDWIPLIPTPMHPDYTCGHCVVGAPASTILRAVFGSTPFAFDVPNNGFTRHFKSFEDFAEEESNARIYAGVHFRFAAEAGEQTGRKVAKFVLMWAAKPLAAR